MRVVNLQDNFFQPIQNFRGNDALILKNLDCVQYLDG